MSTLPHHLPPLGHGPGLGAKPSPKRNPFAKPRPKLQRGDDKPINDGDADSFSRTTLLPSILSNSPVRPTHSASAQNVLSTPASAGTRTAMGSSGKPRTSWRLLWRGGLEIGKEGFRLDGITFFAQLSFPPTPSAPTANPFDVPIQHTPAAVPPPPGTPGSPFPLTHGDTDLCLSLESMRGRKYLQVRGLVDLPAEEVLEGESDEGSPGGVQMSISPHAPLLAAYFTGILCRNEKLSLGGRTLSAIMIGLGDEGIDPMTNSTILVYGQRQGDQGVLKLCVGRRRPPPPPPSAKIVRPGEPLPRAPLFFPAKAPKKPLSIFPSRSLSRTSSVSSSIYHPPSLAPSALSTSVSVSSADRAGEKRARSDKSTDEDWKKRKTGRAGSERDHRDKGTARSSNMDRQSSGTPALPLDEDDIFGKKAGANAASTSSKIRSSTGHHPLGDSTGINSTHAQDGQFGQALHATESEEPPSASRAKRRVPQQVLDNKATIRKQTLVMLESRGISRADEQFKDVFGITTKGTYFAFRDRLETSSLSKVDVQRVIATHLDMYLPSSGATSHRSDPALAADADADSADPESQGIMRLTEVEMEEYSEVQLEGTVFHATTTTTLSSDSVEGRIKLESVEEEEEEG